MTRHDASSDPRRPPEQGPLPRIVMVLGKGGVGRSTIATALGLTLAKRGESVLLFEWTLADSIATWFDRPIAGPRPSLIAPDLSIANYSLEEALRGYFVDHLHAGFFYRQVVNAPSVRRMVEAAPGLSELLFLGQLWWLTTLAEAEAGLTFDRIVVDTPATGHGLGILGMPSTLALLKASGLLGLEVVRVQEMMADPRWLGVLVVALAEEMVCEETRELVPEVRRHLGRPPLALVINRSVGAWVGTGGPPDWGAEFGPTLSPQTRATLETMFQGLQGRALREQELSVQLAGTTEWGAHLVPELLGLEEQRSPVEIARALSQQFDWFQ